MLSGLGCRSEHSGGCRQWSRGGERTVGDSDSLARSSGVCDCGAGAWHDQCGAGGADGGVRLHGCGGVDDASGGDGHTGGECCGFCERAGAGCDCEGFACGGGVGFAVLYNGGGGWAEGRVACYYFGGGGGGGGCRGRDTGGLVGECAWAIGDCQGGCLEGLLED